jgi:hypothetical protein
VLVQPPTEFENQAREVPHPSKVWFAMEASTLTVCDNAKPALSHNSRNKPSSEWRRTYLSFLFGETEIPSTRIGRKVPLLRLTYTYFVPVCNPHTRHYPCCFLLIDQAIQRILLSNVPCQPCSTFTVCGYVTEIVHACEMYLRQECTVKNFSTSGWKNLHGVS